MILDDLTAHARERVEAAKQVRSLAQVQEAARALPRTPQRLENALRGRNLSFICEVKKASPSKGVISDDFPYLDIARDYTAAGADAISVLTEPKWFLGSDKIFRDVRAATDLPLLRKDFTVDPYQVYEAKVLGADAVLLICGVLSATEIGEYLSLCDELGLDALVETHDEQQIADAVAVGARIIGVNNRDLRDFSVDTANSARLGKGVPDNVIFVAESGIADIDDVRAAAAGRADAVLVGESLMRADDRQAQLGAFRKAGERR